MTYNVFSVTLNPTQSINSHGYLYQFSWHATVQELLLGFIFCVDVHFELFSPPINGIIHDAALEFSAL